jgi:hypothetical protein
MPNSISPSSPDWTLPKFPEPAPAEVVQAIPLSWLSMDDDPTPLDTKPYQSDLTPLDIPPHINPKSRIPKLGLGGGTGAGQQDELTDLTLAQEIDLLAKNNIFLSTKRMSPHDHSGLGAMAAYVVGDSLEPARKLAVRIKKVRLNTPSTGREGSVAFSYNAFESHLQKHLVSDTNLSAGIPKLFKVDTKYSYATASAAHQQTVSIHFSAMQWVAQAHVQIDEKDIVLDDSFVQEIKAVCESKKSAGERVRDLLSVLDAYGHFVPLSIHLGGRISLSEVTNLSDWSTFETVKHRFEAAASARVKVRSVPVQGGGGQGVLQWTTQDESLQQHATNLKLQVQGGNKLIGDTNQTAFGSDWLDSVGPYKNWRTFGFGKHSLVSILEFLPKNLKTECEKLLQGYFTRLLVVKESRFVGHPSAEGDGFLERELKYADGRPLDRDLGKASRGPSKIVVTAQGHVDGIKVTYDIYAGMDKHGTLQVSGSYGRKDRDKKYDFKPVTFGEGEVISALECWVDPHKDGGTLRRLAIRTSAGSRYPTDAGFYGTNHKPGDRLEILEAPRVRALRGYKGEFIHAVGVAYLDLAKTDHQNYLQAMEPILFPTGDFGPISGRPGSV